MSVLVADEQANTALHLAAAAGEVAICRALVAKGADCDVKNARLQTAVDLATSNKQLAVVRLFQPTLSDKEFTDEACASTARLRAARAGDLETLRATTDEGQMTALMVACRAGQFAAVEELLASSHINAQSASGFTALYLASEEGGELVRLLLAHGADVALADFDDGGAPLARACFFGHEACARVLIDAKAAVDAADSDGWTALMWPARMVTRHARVCSSTRRRRWMRRTATALR